MKGMTQGIESDLLLYAVGSHLIFQHTDIYEIEKILNKYFAHIFNWFVEKQIKYSLW